MKRFSILVIGIFSFYFLILGITLVYATPSTHIWSPSTDIQPYRKVHVTSDFYFPVDKKDLNDNRVYTGEVYGLTFSLLSDDPNKNPLGKVMAEAGFDYKKGFGSFLDTYPWYFHFKLGVPEDAYFKNMPALAFGGYDLGIKHNVTDYDIWYAKTAKTFVIDKLNLGRFSVGYFKGSKPLLLNKDRERDNKGIMLAWERTMSEISDRLWICADYQATQSSYGAMNYGFAWKFTDNISAIAGYEIYNNPNLRDTITFQLDVDF
ncbi:MAG: hypothetical protein PHS93_02705 [Candidatus Omnitrophica bacterium]|nr:hypothetical protein [Candidatus Omnitrophota bacterium]MDD5352060.1 hypothetical protein [Candidatus Omnitrophota bacterium]MDD5549658.1 hypothetical protein [Candidatus Omnitrophota bacterium]